MNNILFLAADPTDASRLRLGEETREIQEKLQLAKLRADFSLYQKFSVRPSDITQALLDTEPLIVHFSGHGTKNGEICIEDKNGKTHPIHPDALSQLFEQFSQKVKCVVLNACYSEVQARAIAKHIDYVVGMNRAIGDKAAIAFSVGFYQALGAGRSITESFKLGCVQILMENIPEHLTPILITKTSGELKSYLPALEQPSTPIIETKRGSKNIRVALWGPSASGKSTFVAMLYGACLKEESKWAVKPHNAISTDFIFEQIRFLSRGMFPAATSPQIKPSIYSFEFALKDANSSKKIVVEFTDIAGEEYLTSSMQSELWDFLSSCDGIICLLDPSQASQHINMAFILLQSLFMKQREAHPSQNYLPHHIAFCFSKIDMAEYYEYVNNPAKLVKDLEIRTGVNMHRLLKAYFSSDRVKFFCVSSLGVDSNNQSLVKENLVIPFNKLRPINVLEPIEWLLDTLS